MYSIPKFLDVVKLEEIDYINNCTNEEIDYFIESMNNIDYLELLDESEKTDLSFLKWSKDILDALTDNRWSKFTPKEKQDFLTNYKWDGKLGFIPTNVGKLKAGAIGSLAGGIKTGDIISNISGFVLAKTLVKIVTKSPLNAKVLFDIIKRSPKGAAIGTVLAALFTGTITLNTTDAKNKDKDYAAKFDLAIKNTKSKLKSFIDKIKNKK